MMSLGLGLREFKPNEHARSTILSNGGGALPTEYAYTDTFPGIQKGSLVRAWAAWTRVSSRGPGLPTVSHVSK